MGRVLRGFARWLLPQRCRKAPPSSLSPGLLARAGQTPLMQCHAPPPRPARAPLPWACLPPPERRWHQHARWPPVPLSSLATPAAAPRACRPRRPPPGSTTTTSSHASAPAVSHHHPGESPAVACIGCLPPYPEARAPRRSFVLTLCLHSCAAAPISSPPHTQPHPATSPLLLRPAPPRSTSPPPAGSSLADSPDPDPPTRRESAAPGPRPRAVRPQLHGFRRRRGRGGRRRLLGRPAGRRRRRGLVHAQPHGALHGVDGRGAERQHTERAGRPAAAARAGPGAGPGGGPAAAAVMRPAAPGCSAAGCRLILFLFFARRTSGACAAACSSRCVLQLPRSARRLFEQSAAAQARGVAEARPCSAC